VPPLDRSELARLDLGLDEAALIGRMRQLCTASAVILLDPPARLDLDARPLDVLVPDEAAV
jgi:hypothetical protein